jgi:polyhydroxyalkanoate synthase
LSNGWRPSNHETTPTAKFDQSLAALSPDTRADIQHRILDLSHRRYLNFLKGVKAYRHHPYRRRLQDPPSCHTVASSRLLDYGHKHHKTPSKAPAAVVVLIPSLVNKAYVMDLQGRTSFARYLKSRNIQTYMLDWGEPTATEASFNLGDYVTRAITFLEYVRNYHQRPPILAGYCMGGLLALAAALRRPDLCHALACIATPWNFHACVNAKINHFAESIAQLIDLHGHLPVDALQTCFAAVDPLGIPRKFEHFARLPHRTSKANTFVALEDWLNDGVPLVADVARECFIAWYRDNTPHTNIWHNGGVAMRPEALTCPSLSVIPMKDRIVPPQSALSLAARLPHNTTLRLAFGHIGIMTSTAARKNAQSPIANWLQQQW